MREQPSGQCRRRQVCKGCVDGAPAEQITDECDAGGAGLSDWHGALPTQAALARFVDEGRVARHIRKVARAYAMRHAKIVEAIRLGFGGRLRVVPSVAGLHVTAEVAPGVSLDVDQFVRRAEARGIVVNTLADFSAEASPRAGLVLGYSAIPTENVDEGLRRLARCFR